MDDMIEQAKKAKEEREAKEKADEEQNKDKNKKSNSNNSVKTKVEKTKQTNTNQKQSQHHSDGYDTPEEAVRNAYKEIAPYSQKYTREMGGRLYYDPSTKKYYYTRPAEGTARSVDTGQIPSKMVDAGMYHTHPNNDTFSGPDVNSVSKGGYAYVMDVHSDQKDQIGKKMTGRIARIDAYNEKKEYLKETVEWTVQPKESTPVPAHWKQGNIGNYRFPRRFKNGEINKAASKYHQKSSVYDQKTGKLKPQYNNQGAK